MRYDDDDDDDDGDIEGGNDAMSLALVDDLLAMDILTTDLRQLLYRSAGKARADIRRRRYDQLRRQAALFDDDVVELHYLADTLRLPRPATYRYDVVSAMDVVLDSLAAHDDARWETIRKQFR